ncbi:hypothetical protein N7501_006431 [Penicillium viridicatum]|nr:hypothetical protein N7501_006431 [Penicillium viridicatum]
MAVPKSKHPSQGQSKKPNDSHYAWDKINIRSCEREDAIFTKWDRVRDEIVKWIDLKYVSTIGYYRVGRKNSPRKGRPTIFIFGNHAKYPKSFEPARNIIDDILKKHKVTEVEVEFLEGQFRRHASDPESEEHEPKPKRDTEECGGFFHQDVVRLPSLPGQSLALKENASASGTFGGFFEVTLPGITEPKVMGLTCFHVINPTEKGKSYKAKFIIRKWRKEGIMPNDTMAKHLKVDHPSPRAIHEKTRALKKEVADIQSPTYMLLDDLVTNEQDIRKGDSMRYEADKRRLLNCKALLKQLEDFDAGFGKVWAASGFRRGQAPSIDSGEHRLSTNYDWALIEVPRQRVGHNITPEGHVLNQSPLPKSFDNLTLCISGQKSGYSEGRYNALKEANVEHELIDGTIDSVTMIEHSVISSEDGTFFARSGDSGSLVYTKGRQVLVGLFFAGRTRPPCSASFTNIDDLINDIKSTTGATEVRLL